MIPEQIRQAASIAYASAPPGHHSSEVVVGEISVAVSPSVSCSDHALKRIVTVIGKNDEAETVDILLVSNEIENATDLDLIVTPDSTGIPYTVMIQSELYGPVFSDQLIANVGSIDDDLREAVATALTSDGESLDGHETGLPLGGFSDPRRVFKVNELEDLEQLVSSCRQWLAGEAADVRLLDPELLIPPPSGTSMEDATDRFIQLLDVLDEVGSGSVSIGAGLLALLDELKLIDELSRWGSDFGFDTSRILASMRVIEDELEVSSSTGVKLGPTGRRTEGAFNSYLRSQAEGGHRTVDVHTVSRCWSGSLNIRVIRADAGNVCRVRPRILEEVQ